MKLIIDIDFKDYEELSQFGECEINLATLLRLQDAVIGGTPLPKGHGRLIDAEVTKKEFNKRAMEWEGGVVDVIPTIIEADKKESEDKE